jgi:hypothetical protein
MRKSDILSHCAIKSVSAGLIAAVLDNYIVENGSRNSYSYSRNIAFGVLVGSSVALGDYISPSLTHMTPIPDTALFSGKTLEHRLIELSLGLTTTVGVNRYIYGTTVGTMAQQVGIVVLADVLGEYIADYAKSQPLNYLN